MGELLVERGRQKFVAQTIGALCVQKALSGRIAAETRAILEGEEEIAVLHQTRLAHNSEHANLEHILFEVLGYHPFN